MNNRAGKRSRKIVILDYGVGNIKSICNSLKQLSIAHQVVSEPKELQRGSGGHLLVPGVASFSSSMRALRSIGWDEYLIEHACIRELPLMGICSGFQIMSRVGEEGGTAEGLSLIDADCRSINHGSGPQIKLPNVGFCQITESSGLTELRNKWFYFVHSFMVFPDEYANGYDGIQIASVEGKSILAGIQKNNLWGFQFHPEKSRLAGLKIFDRFSEL
jgi:glutamine amidotransferase